MNYNEVKDLIRTIESSTIHDFELNIDNVAVKMSKGTLVSQAIAQEIPRTEVPRADIPITIMPQAAPPLTGHIIASPIVGTFYASADPAKPNFVQIGQKVKKGDVLCILEAMKIMNEITADVDGEIEQIFATNEQMVEYNQPLFRIA